MLHPTHHVILLSLARSDENGLLSAGKPLQQPPLNFSCVSRYTAGQSQTSGTHSGNPPLLSLKPLDTLESYTVCTEENAATLLNVKTLLKLVPLNQMMFLSIHSRCFKHIFFNRQPRSYNWHKSKGHISHRALQNRLWGLFFTGYVI